jgi:type VI secretion system protein
MRIALLDALTGRFGGDVASGGERVVDVPEEEQLLHSVLGNLRRLFNARRGSLAHLPEYGLPDLSDVSPSSPQTIESLRVAIREAVERFEPRLQNVRITREAGPAIRRTSCFLSAQMGPTARVRFQTTIRSSEPVEIGRNARCDHGMTRPTRSYGTTRRRCATSTIRESNSPSPIRTRRSS